MLRRKEKERRLLLMQVAAPPRPTGSVNKDLLHFLTCGSVDDRNSPLIGRLLHDRTMIFGDQMSALPTDSKRHGSTGDDIDFALLVDGLEAEREQGITASPIGFYQPKVIFHGRGYSPTRTAYQKHGGSNAQLPIILVDAGKGLLVQTWRHFFICSLLGIRRVVPAVNKIDLMGFEQQVFALIANYVSLPPGTVSARSF
jgi:bifunctional enzyme CysN/CysC